MDINTVSLIGNVGKNPELKYTTSGTAVTKLNLACSRYKKTADGQPNEVTSWFDVVVWGKQAENVCKFVDRGDRIAVSGYLEQRSWEKDGQKRYQVEVISEKIQFLTDKRDKQSQHRRSQGTTIKRESFGAKNSGPVPEDIPF